MLLAVAMCVSIDLRGAQARDFQKYTPNTERTRPINLDAACTTIRMCLFVGAVLIFIDLKS